MERQIDMRSLVEESRSLRADLNGTLARLEAARKERDMYRQLSRSLSGTVRELNEALAMVQNLVSPNSGLTLAEARTVFSVVSMALNGEPQERISG